MTFHAKYGYVKLIASACHTLKFWLACLQRLIAEAEKCKGNGNALYKQKEYEAAAVSFGDDTLPALI